MTKCWKRNSGGVNSDLCNDDWSNVQYSVICMKLRYLSSVTSSAILNVDSQSGDRRIRCMSRIDAITHSYVREIYIVLWYWVCSSLLALHRLSPLLSWPLVLEAPKHSRVSHSDNMIQKHIWESCDKKNPFKKSYTIIETPIFNMLSLLRRVC